MENFNENDYKYVIQEVSKTMIGARYTFAEIMECERVPFKFQTIVDRLILPYSDPDRMIGDELLKLKKGDKNYRIFENLKVKISSYVKAGDGYKEKSYRIDELCGLDDESKADMMVHEVSISNLALMAFKM